MEATLVGWCERWDNSAPFDDDNNEVIECESFVNSLAGCANILAANTHNSIMESTTRSKWIKTSSILLIDVVLLVSVPFIAVAEATLRLVLAIITSPLLLGFICSDWDFLHLPIVLAMTSLNSLCAIVNALYTSYLSLTTQQNINANANQVAIFNCVICELCKEID